MTHSSTRQEQLPLLPTPFRIPAEWEAQGAIAMAWPHAGTDWAPHLAQVQESFATIISAISQTAPVILLVPDKTTAARLENRFDRQPFPVYPVPARYNDTWLRDSLFITAINEEANSSLRTASQPLAWQALDFAFSGWGGKFEAELDNALSKTLLENWQLSDHWQPVPFELEGGSVDFDGAGTILTTTACLQKRHPLPLPVLEQQLHRVLGTRRALWLEHGALEGDDTDSHVDMLARFASSQSIIFQSCDEKDYPHYQSLQRMQAQLKAFRQNNGSPYQLHALPWPDPVRDETGRRLPASYANFLICNRQVLVPVYGCRQDEIALQVIRQAFPLHRVSGIPCRELIWQNGSLHCSTMQVPQRAFRDIETKLRQP